MAVRIVAGLVFAGVFLLSIALGTFTTLAFTALLTVFAAIEMVNAINAAGFNARKWPSVTFAALYTGVAYYFGAEHVFAFWMIMLLAALTVNVLSKNLSTRDMLATVFPFLYPLGFFAFMGIVLMHSHEVWLTLFMTAVGIACLDDVGAYFVGSLMGKHKLAPHISPKKTIEGSIGGIITGTLSSLVFWYCQRFWGASLPLPMFLACGVLASAMGQVGDLVASAIKRLCGIKDYGKLIPGHGGVLDRLDSIIFALPTIYVVYEAFELLGLIAE